MNLTLWIITGLLATAFGIGGAVKLFMPREKLLAGPGGAWVEDFSGGAVKTIGALEILAAVGLVLPGTLAGGFPGAPVLVPLAAVGLVLMMAGAMVVHLRRREYPVLAANLAYLALAGFLAWGRFGPAPLTG